MKVSREQMKANRVRILGVASQLFREKGFEAVSVAEVMKAAGLTHGGFYGHFSSKDELIAQTIAHVFGPDGGARGAGDLADYIDAYLSPVHREGVAGGCPTAALVSDVRRQAPAARCAMTEGLKLQLERMTRAVSGAGSSSARQEAIGTWASMVGALVLARTVEDPDLSDEILGETRAWLGQKSAVAPGD